MLSELATKWLDDALDLGLTEREFWQMTLGELRRWFASARRRILEERRERATFDYRQAKMIGHCFAACFSKSNKPPEIEEIYPELFNDEEYREAKHEAEAERWAAQFRAFMAASDARIEKGVQDG